MIPILYETDETSFTSNGLGRLRDCISCVVTEERNGIYECDFEYPMNGAHFDDITVGRIIGVTHDDTDEIQPFDIVSYTKPIEGIAEFHCTHISYRQSYMTVTGTGINSLADAFTWLSQSQPENPFTYWTNKTSAGYLGASNGIPHSVRQVLGGMQGSILDAYGGEYEWDKWSVNLYDSRGEARDFSIRYGVNMLEYNEEYEIAGTYSSCIPYWTDGTLIVVGNKVDAPGATPTGRGECVPLDLSDKFDTEPSQAQVETMALSYMTNNEPFIPRQSIKVEFLRLQDLTGYEEYARLLDCNLCDTINVIFPDFNSSGRFKIVSTVWDVLRDRYESMELGHLSTTLAEALGISSDTSGNARSNASSDNIVVSLSAFNALPQTITYAGMTSNHVLVHSVLSNPSAQVDNWTVITGDGTFTISGSISGSTSATLYFVPISSGRYGCRVITRTSVSSLPITIQNDVINADDVVVNTLLSNPSAQTANWTVETFTGSLTISGAISGTTDITIYLMCEY